MIHGIMAVIILAYFISMGITELSSLLFQIENPLFHEKSNENFRFSKIGLKTIKLIRFNKYL